MEISIYDFLKSVDESNCADLYLHLRSFLEITTNLELLIREYEISIFK